MNRPIGHRKRVRHIDDPGHVRELTFSCYRRWPLLTIDLWRQLLSESIDRATGRHRYQLSAFVFMPDHVHLVVFPISGASGIDALLLAIKRPFSYRVKQLLQQSRDELLERLTIRQRPGVSSFRFWQEGPGYDRNLTEPKTVVAAIEYVHQNPVRRGLVKHAVDWRWSSARYYLGNNPQQYPGLPTVHPLPAHWLSETS
jgi:putative transposase